MTVGSGLAINLTEKDPQKQNQIIRQLIEGRSNAVGVVTLAHNGVLTTTTVTAPVCGPNSAVFLFQATAHAAAAAATTYVKQTDVTPGQFIVTHAATAQSDQTFFWVALG